MNRDVKNLVLILVVIAGIHSLGIAAEATDEKPAPASVTADWTTYFGRDLSPEEPATSFSFEPDLGYRPRASTRIGLYSFIDRPIDAYENFSVPKTILSINESVPMVDGLKTNATVSFNAVNLHRWNSDGKMLRMTVGLQATKELVSGLTLLARVSPYLQFNDYTQTTAGADLPRAGISERLGLTLDVGQFSIDATAILDQRYHSIWKNDLYLAQSVTYNISDKVGFGLGHELLSSYIDASTGFSGGYQVFDSRKSRVSASIRVGL